MNPSARDSLNSHESRISAFNSNNNVHEIRQRALASPMSLTSDSRLGSPNNGIAGRVEREVEALRSLLSTASISSNLSSSSSDTQSALTGANVSSAISTSILRSRRSPLASANSLTETSFGAHSEVIPNMYEPGRFTGPASFTSRSNSIAEHGDLNVCQEILERRQSSPAASSPSAVSLITNARNNVTVAHIMTDAAQKILPGGTASSSSTSSVNKVLSPSSSSITETIGSSTLERRPILRKVSDYAPSPLRAYSHRGDSEYESSTTSSGETKSPNDSLPLSKQEPSPDISPKSSENGSPLKQHNRKTLTEHDLTFSRLDSAEGRRNSDFIQSTSLSLPRQQSNVTGEFNLANENVSITSVDEPPFSPQSPLFTFHEINNQSFDSLASNTSAINHQNFMARVNSRDRESPIQGTAHIHHNPAHHVSTSRQRRFADANPPQDMVISEEKFVEPALSNEDKELSAQRARPSSLVDAPTISNVSQEDIQNMKAILVKETKQAFEEINSLLESNDITHLSSTIFVYFSQLDKLCKLFVRFPPDNESMYVELGVAKKVFEQLFCNCGARDQLGTSDLLENTIILGLEQLLDHISNDLQVLDNMSVSILTVVLHFITLFEKSQNQNFDSNISVKTKLLLDKLFAAYGKIPDTTSGVIMKRAFEFVYVSSLENFARQEAFDYASQLKNTSSQDGKIDNLALAISPSISAFHNVSSTDLQFQTLDKIKPIVALQIMKNEFRSHLTLIHNYINHRVNTMVKEAKASMTEDELKEVNDDDLSSYGISPSNDTSIERAVIILSSFNEINNTLKLVSYTEFYNDMLNISLQVRDDYPKWKVREGFSFCQYPFVLNTITKSDILKIESMVQMRHGLQDAFFRALFVGVNSPYLVMEIRRAYIIRDAMFQLHSKTPLDLKKQLRISFVGEDGVDEGGVQKEFFQLVFREIFDPQYGMFKAYPDSNLVWFSVSPQSSKTEKFIQGRPDEAWLEDYKLIGKLIGLAIYNGVILDLHFPLALYKKLMGVDVDIDDLKELDSGLADGLVSMLEYKPTSDNEKFDDIFGERFFTVDCEDVLGNKFEVELEPNGQSKPVTWANRAEFVEKYVQYIFNQSCGAAFGALFEGFDQVLGDTVVIIFRPEELEELVCGSSYLDFKELEESTKYDGFTKESDTIKYFWEVVHEFTPEQKKKLLFFTTGTDRVPIGGLSKLSFIIAKNGADDNRLPTAHTCFNVLMLSQYSTKELLREKIFQALEFSDGGFFLS